MTEKEGHYAQSMSYRLVRVFVIPACPAHSVIPACPESSDACIADSVTTIDKKRPSTYILSHGGELVSTVVEWDRERMPRSQWSRKTTGKILTANSELALAA